MFRVVSNIKISQQPSKVWPNRKTIINLDFVTEYEADSGWRDLSDGGHIVIPKNLYFVDQYGKKHPLSGPNVNLGGFSSAAPLVLRGDKVSIVGGYKYFATKNASRETTTTNEIFNGWVTKVDSNMPIHLKLEDNMWKLKQTPVDTHTFSKRDGLSAILKNITDKCNEINGTNLTYSALTETTFGSFTIGNETACQVLQRLQKLYGFESYFAGNELRCGLLVYVTSEAKTIPFTFQYDIIENELEYVRKDDITLSAIARNTIEESTGKTTKDGNAKTKRKRLEVLVTLKNDIKTVKVIHEGDVVATNEEGERRTFHFPGAITVDQLATAAFQQLEKYYYTGLKGCFTTFGLPYVKWGDNVKLTNKILPEQDGVYKVKKVEYSGGVKGMRQKIHLDFKLKI